MKTIKIIILTIFPLCFAFAQNDLVHIQLNPSCTNDKDDVYQINLLIKSNDVSNTIRVAEQNYRFVFNTEVLQNPRIFEEGSAFNGLVTENNQVCLLYTSPSPRDATLSRMPSSA